MGVRTALKVVILFYTIVLVGCESPTTGTSGDTLPTPQSSPNTPPPKSPTSPTTQSRPLTSTDRQQSAVIIQSVIRETLRKPTGSLTPADRQQITELYLIDLDITDLSTLSDLPRLKVLNLRGNRVADLRPLAGLTHLEKLGLDGNRVTDLTPLRGLKKLAVLELFNNPNLPPAQVHLLLKALPECRVLNTSN